MADEQTPLLNTTAADGEQTADEVPFVPVSTLPYYWCALAVPPRSSTRFRHCARARRPAPAPLAPHVSLTRVVSSPVVRERRPCMIAGVVANTAAVCASVAITKDILDTPSRATFYQSHWYIVWLVGLLLLSGACAATAGSARSRPFGAVMGTTPLTHALRSQLRCLSTCSRPSL